MAAKGNRKISVDGDRAANVLGKITAAHDSPGLHAGTFTVQAPANAPAVAAFNYGLNQYGASLQVGVAKLRERLMQLHDDINRTVTELVERDAASSDEATALLSSIPTSSATSSTTPPPAQTTGLG